MQNRFLILSFLTSFFSFFFTNSLLSFLSFQSGLLSSQYLTQVWKRYKTEQQLQILALLERFEIVFRLKNSTPLKDVSLQGALDCIQASRFFFFMFSFWESFFFGSVIGFFSFFSFPFCLIPLFLSSSREESLSGRQQSGVSLGPHELILIPSACAVNRPSPEEMWKQWGLAPTGPPSPPGCSIIARVYEFDSVPVGFVGRVAVRMLNMERVVTLNLWRDGVMLASVPPGWKGEGPIQDHLLDPQVFCLFVYLSYCLL